MNEAKDQSTEDARQGASPAPSSSGGSGTLPPNVKPDADASKEPPGDAIGFLSSCTVDAVGVSADEEDKGPDVRELTAGDEFLVYPDFTTEAKLVLHKKKGLCGVIRSLWPEVSKKSSFKSYTLVATVSPIGKFGVLAIPSSARGGWNKDAVIEDGKKQFIRVIKEKDEHAYMAEELSPQPEFKATWTKDSVMKIFEDAFRDRMITKLDAKILQQLR